MTAKTANATSLLNKKVIQVEKNVTLRHGSPGYVTRGASQYPFDKLTPGMYLEFGPDHPGSVMYESSRASKVAGPAYAYGKRRGWKISISYEADGATRVYRTA